MDVQPKVGMSAYFLSLTWESIMNLAPQIIMINFGVPQKDQAPHVWIAGVMIPLHIGKIVMINVKPRS